ncbi:MAG TPA: nucleotidyltransferase domain-containing protein [Bacteroidales bacterium]|nr:nucleotidyltransferase domain-containing protein [Bacteroidales bacterium]HPT01343.1 nucleotidyltransferase domain-containing protein [Bacteroidales bacterium]
MMTVTDKYGLNEIELENIISVFKENAKIDKVVLFGSRAIGNYSTGSDIDISISGRDLLLNDVLDLSIKLDEFDFPYKFDILIYNDIKEKALVEHIDRVGVVIYSRYSFPDK